MLGVDKQGRRNPAKISPVMPRSLDSVLFWRSDAEGIEISGDILYRHLSALILMLSLFNLW